MKIIQFIRPINDKKRLEIEHELAEEKRRFFNASQRAKDALQYDLSIRHWLEDYPIESALVVMAGGFILARLLSRSRRRLTSRGGSARVGSS